MSPLVNVVRPGAVAIVGATANQLRTVVVEVDLTHGPLVSGTGILCGR